MEKERKYSVIEDAFDEICSFDSLMEAHRNARKGKRYRDDVLRFTSNLESNIINLSGQLSCGSYEVGPYHPFFIHEPKTRLVMSLQYPDRVVQWSIYNKLYPFYDKMMIEDSYACRKNKGSHKAADRLQNWLRLVSRKHEKWFYLKLDIGKYFYRVDHGVLEEILQKRIKDDRLMTLLRKIINSESMRFGLPEGMSPGDCPEDLWQWDVGMPIGNLTSQLFANIYLNELDQFCKHKLHIRYYVRYMDDVIILFNHTKQLTAWKEDIALFLKDKLKLQLNKKTAMRPISHGIDFVGYKIWATHRKLKKQTARRIIHHVVKMSSLEADGVMSKEEFLRVAASYRGVMQHCNSYGLRRKLNNIATSTEKRDSIDGHANNTGRT